MKTTAPQCWRRQWRRQQNEQHTKTTTKPATGNCNLIHNMNIGRHKDEFI